MTGEGAPGAIILPPQNERFNTWDQHQSPRQEYVTRSEYETLRKDLDRLSENTGLYQQVSQPGEIELLPESPREQYEEYIELPWSTARIPGWQRARTYDWLGMGRLQRMTTRIGRSGDMDLYLGLNTVGRLQYLQQANVFDTVGPSSVVPGALEPGIQSPFGQLSFLLDFSGAMEVFFDVFISSRPHEDELQANEGFILFRDLPGPLEPVFEFVHVKAGGFEMDFGDAHYRRSVNAEVLRNPLIGNYVVDPRVVDIGFEFFNPPGTLPVNWLVGVGVGNNGDFQAHRSVQVHSKLYMDTARGSRASFSFFWTDHSGNPTGFPGTGSSSGLFRSNRSGGPYEDVIGAGNAPGQITPGAGQQVTAGQFDLTSFRGPWEFYGHFGVFRDADMNGSAPGTPTESWLYYAGESIYRFTPRTYVATRYSGTTARRLVSTINNAVDVTSGGAVHRFQVGGGVWVHDTILVKLEYVYQFYKGFTADGSQVSRVDAFRDPSFNGVLMEIGFTL